MYTLRLEPQKTQNKRKTQKIRKDGPFLKLVNEVMPRVREVSVAEAIERQAGGATLIDVREDNEWDAGHARRAIHMGRGVIERDIVHQIPDKDAELVLYCGAGYRSALAAENLQKMGYSNVRSMAGGWAAWKEADASMSSEMPS